MTELLISPLARRIAEENNVDWRVLEGSDAGGGVNERDILNYLEGVMLGTKPVDPTPEPRPAGMSAWAEEPVYLGVALEVAAISVDAATPEAVYRELFAELGVLKKAAAAAEQARRKEGEAARQLQLELSRVKTTLANRETELTASRARLSDLEADLETRKQRAGEAQLELTRLRETRKLKDEELARVPALKQQLETLKAQLGGAAAQAKVPDLIKRLAEAEYATQTAQAEVGQLKVAHAGLEQTLAEKVAKLKLTELKLAEFGTAAAKQRPWWKLWG